jgi:DNA repair photolyase
LERKYQLTRGCLQILVEHNWPTTVQTRSPLVLRDMDILQRGESFEVGMSITTADDNVRYLFEPSAPPIPERIRTLDELHQAGIRTFAMVAPLLPGCEDLPDLLAGKVDFVILDRMNYHHSDWVYRKYGLEDKNTDEFFDLVQQSLWLAFEGLGIECQV